MATSIDVNIISATCTVSGNEPSFYLTWASSNTQELAFYQIRVLNAV